jgi:hypothetical protein
MSSRIKVEIAYGDELINVSIPAHWCVDKLLRHLEKTHPEILTVCVRETSTSAILYPWDSVRSVVGAHVTIDSGENI